MKHEELSDEKLQQRLDDAILKADPEKLTDDEIDRRLYLRENGHKSPDLLRGSINAAGDILGMAGTVADYPQGIARAGAEGIRGMLMNDKSASEGLDGVVEALKGPSHAPGWADIMENVGVPEDAAFPAGLGMDILTGTAEGWALNKGAKGLSNAARGALDADEMALKAVGSTKKLNREMLAKAPLENPMQNLDKASKYAQENVLSPLSSTRKVYDKALQKFDEVGKKIGALREKNQALVSKWLASNPEKQEAAEYLNGTFEPRKSLNRIFEKIDQDIADPDYANQVKDTVAKKMNALLEKYQGKEIPIQDISKLKSGWQREVNFGKEAADYSVREDAFNYLQREADRAIDNEVTFGDKYLKGDDLVKHKKLKEEYGMLANMTKNLRSKLAGEIASPGGMKLNPLTWELDPTKSTRGQSLIATLPENPKPFGIKSQAVGTAGQVMNMRDGEYKERTFEGFPASKTMQVMPQEVQMFESDIQKSDLSNVEKARRINLLRKHGRAYIGQ